MVKQRNLISRCLSACSRGDAPAEGLSGPGAEPAEPAPVCGKSGAELLEVTSRAEVFPAQQRAQAAPQSWLLVPARWEEALHLLGKSNPVC